MRFDAIRRRSDLAKRRLRAPAAPLPDSLLRKARRSAAPRYRAPKPHFGDKTRALSHISVVDNLSTTETKRLRFLFRSAFGVGSVHRLVLLS